MRRGILDGDKNNANGLISAGS